MYYKIFSAVCWRRWCLLWTSHLWLPGCLELNSVIVVDLFFHFVYTNSWSSEITNRMQVYRFLNYSPEHCSIPSFLPDQIWRCRQQLENQLERNANDLCYENGHLLSSLVLSSDHLVLLTCVLSPLCSWGVCKSRFANLNRNLMISRT